MHFLLQIDSEAPRDVTPLPRYHNLKLKPLALTMQAHRHLKAFQH